MSIPRGRARELFALGSGFHDVRAYSELIEAQAGLLLGQVERRPDVTLAELQALLHERGVAVCIGTVWRFFERRSKPDRSRVTYGGHIICYWTALTIFAAQMDKFGYHCNGRWSNLAISNKKL